MKIRSNKIVNMISVLFVACLLSQHAFAHKDKSSNKHEKRMNHILTELNLDDGRANEVSQILTDAHQSRQTLIKSHKEERKAHRESIKQKLATVLTPEELEKLERTTKKPRDSREKKAKKQIQ